MAHNGQSKVSQNRLTAAERQVAALRLRKSGLTLDAIAKKLGYSTPSGAYRAIVAALQKTLQEPADELRTMECERLDAMLNAIWPQVEAGKGWAIDRVLGIMDRRAKLLGLDAPLKREDTFRVIQEQAATMAASEFGLDPADVIAEAQQIMAKAAH